MIFKLYKWFQIAQRITYYRVIHKEVIHNVWHIISLKKSFGPNLSKNPLHTIVKYLNKFSWTNTALFYICNYNINTFNPSILGYAIN